MIRKPFAKLFDTPDGQLLYFKHLDEDELPVITVMGAALGGICPSVHLGYDDEDHRDRIFEEISQHDADMMAKDLTNTVCKMFPSSMGKAG